MAFKNFIDANNEDVPNNLKTSVCIIGAGAAGITLANNLAEIDVVLLVESGDFEIDGRTQALYSGSNIGLPYFDLLGCRLRYFGGTTNQAFGILWLEYNGFGNIVHYLWDVHGYLWFQ